MSIETEHMARQHTPGTLQAREQFMAMVLTAPLSKADAAVVLAGQDGAERAAVAIGLIKQGASDTVVLSGGVDSESQKSAKTLFSLLVGQGLSPSRIIEENESTNTKEQAVNVRKIAKEKGWKSLLLVASPYHLPRATLTFIKGFRGMDIKIVPCTANQVAWWGKPEGTTTTRLALLEGEFAKTSAYQELGDCASYEDGIKYLKKWESK